MEKIPFLMLMLMLMVLPVFTAYAHAYAFLMLMLLPVYTAYAHAYVNAYAYVYRDRGADFRVGGGCLTTNCLIRAVFVRETPPKTTLERNGQIRKRQRFLRGHMT